MSYLVTARKWRPITFEDVVGQEHITKTLKNAIAHNRIAHAYLFAGPRGIGKTTTARILAKILNCLEPSNGEPCNKCNMCDSFNNSQSLDVIEIDGASNRRIEEIRTLRESVKYAPTKGKYKVYIIDEVHMLTTESFNALLKTLEEPPEQTIFIFATTDIHKVPLTIISRCQRFDFRRIDINTIKETLKKIAEAENIIIDDKSLTTISKKADGALRDAESIFDQVVSFCGNQIRFDEVAQMLNLIDEDIFFEVSDSIVQKNFKQAFHISQKIYDNGWNYIDFINGLIEHFRNTLTVVVREDSSFIETTEANKEKYREYIDKYSEGDLIRILNYLNKVLYEIKSASNQKLKIEISLFHLIGFEKSATISDLISKIETGDLETSYKKKVVEPTLTESSETSQPEQFVKFTAPKLPQKSNIDFELINSNWIKFVQLINSEKFTLGSHLYKSKPISLDGNRLTIFVESGDDVDVITSNENYINCLVSNSEQIFTKKLKFEFTTDNTKLNESQMAGKKSPISNVDTNLSHEENSLVQAIINQLGGREVSR